MRAQLLSICTAWLLLCTAAAVFIDDAWQVDYHLALLGLPVAETTFFHQPSAGSKASLIYTLSERNVLGAVNPKDGTLVWRQHLQGSANGTTAHLRAGQGQDIVVSAVDGQVAGWSAADGRQAWTVQLGEESVKDMEILELDEGKDGARLMDALVLSGESPPHLRRIDAASGAVRWRFTDESGDVPYQVSVSATQVFYTTLHTTLLGGHKIRVTTLDPVNGRKTDEYTLSSESEVSSQSDILSVGANTASPIIAWTDKATSVLKVNVIGSKTVSTFKIDRPSGQSIEKISLHAPYHTNARSHFLVHYQTAEQHWAEVYHVDLSASSVTKAYSLPKLAGGGAFSTSSSDANVYFTRISQGEVSVVSSASHGILARWPLAAMGVMAKDVAPVHAASELSVKGDTVSASRSVVLLSSGDWILIRDGVVSWQRPEALAHTTVATWAHEATDQHAVEQMEKEAHSNVLQAYIHRVGRHVVDLQALPAFLSEVPGKVLHSLGLGSIVAEQSSLAHNSFGYHKLVVCLTDTGRLIALDAGAQGDVVWNVKVPGHVSGASLQTPGLYAQPDGTLVYQPQTNYDVGQAPSVFINSTTGTIVSSGSLVDSAGDAADRSVRYGLHNGNAGQQLSGRYGSAAAALWTYPTGEDEVVLSTAHQLTDEPIASIGKVLGDRRVLYKYLNPNLLLIATGSRKSRTVTVNVIDSLSGSTLYSVRHNDVDLSIPIASAMSENWFAYSLTVDSTDAGAKGHQLMIGELYESSIPNDRGPTRNASEGRLDYEPYVALQTFVIPEPISHMSVSQTRQGITSKELLAVLPESNAIIGIPRTILDARRPVDRDANKDEQFEGLMRYTPLLEFDPRWYLNHQRELMGIDGVTTSPALVESTSLVFAYGLDVFGTRISPSFSFDVLGKDFNKLQMLATVVALFVGTLLAAPVVARKQVDTRWLFS